jgi:flagellar protein FliO/FliZ
VIVEYLARLALILPLLGALIYGSLKLSRRLQDRLAGPEGEARAISLVETRLLAPGVKLAVVRFRDRDVLLGCSRQGLVRLAEAPAPAAPQTELPAAGPAAGVASIASGPRALAAAAAAS